MRLIDGKNIKSYIDFVPLVFCVNNYPDNLSFSGINLNTLPGSNHTKDLLEHKNIVLWHPVKTYNINKNN